eukprot:m.214750 g.214750  ORF g.214750 m.214750 type:complete len:593 (-) comp19078_c0_seq1:205-1983(-)
MNLLRTVFLLVVLLFAVCICIAGGHEQSIGTTFYVSSSNRQASDAHSGTSRSKPWKTLARAAKQLYATGDSLLLHEGDTFVGGVSLRISGTTEKLVTIATYSDAAEEIALNGQIVAGAEPNRPSIVGPLVRGGSCLSITATKPSTSMPRGSHQKNFSQTSTSMVQHGPSNILVQGIAFRNAENGLSFVYHTSTLDGQTMNTSRSKEQTIFKNISVIDCHFDRIQWAAPYPQNISIVYGGGRAISLVCVDDTQQPTPVPVLSDFRIANCLATEVDMFYTNRIARVGRPPNSTSDPGTVATRAVLIANNTVFNSSFNQIVMDSTEAMVVEGNAFIRDVPRIRFGWGTTDIIMGFLDASNAVTGNDFTLRAEHSGDPDGCPIDLESPCNGTHITNNIFYRATAAGINIFGHKFPDSNASGTSMNLDISNNAFLECGCEQGHAPYTNWSMDKGAIAFDLPGGTGHITQNYIVACADPSVPLWGGDTVNRDGYTFKDNTIFDGSRADMKYLPLPLLRTDPTTGKITAACTQGSPQGSLVRYTTDNSLPTETSPLWPSREFTPKISRDSVVNVRCFGPGVTHGGAGRFSPNNGILIRV